MVEDTVLVEDTEEDTVLDSWLEVTVIWSG